MYSRKLVFAAACLGMFVFGIVMTTLGTILPSVTARFGMDLSHAGSLIALLSGGILMGSIIFGPIVDRYGYRILLAVCTALVGLGLVGIAAASSVMLLRAAVLLIGFGGGVINGGTNALVADVSEGGRSAGLSLLGVFYGLGALSIPLLLGALLQQYGYAAPIAVVGAVASLPVLFFLAIRFPAPKQVQGFPIKDGLKLIRQPVLLLFGLMLFLQSGIEMTVGNWTTSFFTSEMNLSPEGAALALSTFLIGMTLSRLVLGALLSRFAPGRVLTTCIVIAAAGGLLMIAAREPGMAISGLFLLGAGLAAGFPVVLGYVGDRYAQLSGTAFSIVLVIALAGGSLLPFLVGILGEALGLRASFTLIPVSLALMILLLFRALHRIAPARSGT